MNGQLYNRFFDSVRQQECAYIKTTITEEEYQKRTENGTKPLVPMYEKSVYMMNMSCEQFLVNCITYVLLFFFVWIQEDVKTYIGILFVGLIL